MSTYVSETPVCEGDGGDASKKHWLSCAHCLSSARMMSLAEGAKACYCKLTRSLSRSVKSLAAVEFASGCCSVEAIRRRRKTCGGCPGKDNDHDHDHEHDHVHEHDHDHDHDHDHNHDHDHDHENCQGHHQADRTKPADGLFAMKEGSVETLRPSDLEAGPRYSRHLALGVSGMHCSTCADDVSKILQNIAGVDKNEVKVSFVMSRAELTFDPAIIQDVDTDIRGKVLKRFPRLDIVVLVNSKVEDNELDGIMRVRIRSQNSDAEHLCRIATEISGVISVSSVDAKQIELAYDPDRIGIRNILSTLNDQEGGLDNVELADVPDGAVIAQQAEKKHLRSIARQTILAALFTIPVLVLAWSGNKIKMDAVVRYAIECACATAIIIVARRIYLDAFQSVWHGFSIDMDVLVSVATGAAYAFSVAVFAAHAGDSSWGHNNEREPFFETSCLLTTLILAGRWMTAGVRSWASQKIRTIGDSDLQAAEVRLYDPEKNQETQLDAGKLHYGDVIVVSQGEKVATDGLVIGGTAQTDESHLTGEPKPQTKSEGSYVLAGSKMVSGDIKYRVSKLVQENTISTIKNMVKLASQQKPRVQEVADRIAAVLTPSILFIACIVFMIWLLVGALGQHREWGHSALNAVTYAVATLAISCPCAIGLAVPTVLVVASRAAVSKGGFVFRNPAAVEKGRNVGKVIFDKTGTLTTGQLQVEFSWILVNGVWQKDVPAPEIFTKLRMLCKTSNHPVAKAMFRFSESRSPFPSSSVEPEIATIVSKGIETTIDGAVYRGGKLSFTSPAAVNDPEVIKILASAQSVFTLSRDSQLVAFFGLKDDTIRPEVPGVLQKLRDRGIELFIFSGDRPEAVFPVAKELGIPASNVFGDCYPEDKRARLEILKCRIQDGRATEKADNKVELASSPQATPSSRFRPSGWLRSLSPKFLRNQRKSIVFVGDGTNDAIALMAADIGISLSQSTDMAASSADVAIISDSIVALVGFLDLSERVGLCIRINFAWAIVWNLVAIMGASGAWVDVRIAPEWAGLGEMGSVLPVFLVSWAVGWGYSSGTG